MFSHPKHFLGQESPIIQQNAYKLHENSSRGETEGWGEGEALGVGPRGPLGPLFVILGSPSSLQRGSSGYLVLSYPICPPCCLWGWPHTSGILLSADIISSGSGSALVGMGMSHVAWSQVPTAPSPGQVPPSHEAPTLLCSWPRGWGWEGLLPRRHPGGPGSLQAVGLQLQTPKHILWEVSLACGWGIPLFR